MRKAIASFTLLAACAAFWGFAPPPDSVRRGNATCARRGSLGADDYVVTNVAPCSSCYELSVPDGGMFRDRAVNALEGTGDVQVFVPTNAAAPGAARAFCVYLKAKGSGCRLSVGGVRKVLLPDGSDGLSFPSGEHFVSFLELEKDVFMADSRELVGQ